MSFNKKQLKKDSPKKNAIDLKLKPIKKNPNYKYGFSQFQPGEGNLMLGAGFGNSKIGMGAMGMTPLDAENRKYFKGLVDANINYNVNPNLNFRLGVNDVIGGGFNPGINAGIKLKFGAGGGLLSKTMKCNSCGWSWKAVDGGNDIYNCHKCSGKALPQNFKEGGEYVDLELDENDIEYYKNQGYLVEYLEGGANPNDPPKKSDDGAIHVTDPNDPDYLKYLEHNKLYRKLKDNLRAKQAKNAEKNLKIAKDWLDMVKNDWKQTYDDLDEVSKEYYHKYQKVIAEKGTDKNYFSDSKYDVDKLRNQGKKVKLSDEDESYLEQAKALGLDIKFRGLSDSSYANPIVPRPKQKYILDKATTHKDKIKNYKTSLEEYNKEAKVFKEYDKGYNQRKEDWKNNYNSYKEKLNKDWGEARGVQDWKVGLNNADGRGVDYLINQGFDIDDITWNDLHWVQQNVTKEGEGFNSSNSFIKPVLNKFTEKYTEVNPTEPTKPKVTLPEGYSYRVDNTRDDDINDYLKGNKRISREEFIKATDYAPTQFRERHIKTPKFKEGGLTEPEYTYLELDDDAIQQYKNGGWVVEDVDSIPKYPDGGTVSQMWEKETGTPWSEAKAQGLADGSYDSNMALRKRLAAGEFSNTPAITPPVAVPTNTPMELVPESVSVEPIIENNSNFEIPNEIVPSAKQVAALSNDKGAEGLASDPNFAKVYNPRTIKNPFEDKVPNDDAEYDIQNAASFSEAFGIARETYGPNYIFEYKGRSFGTNKKGEDFKPTNKVLKKHKLDTPEVKKRIEQETKEVESPFFSKETIKLEADGYESWEDAKLRKEEFNKQDNADKIIDYHKNAPSKENFVIVDKAKGLMHIYKPNGELLYSEAFDVNTGKNEGDNQTVTKPKDLDGDGRITNDGDKVNGKFQPDWSAGNKSTGAGKYYISNIDPTGYKGLPILNMMNEGQYDKFKETGQVDNVATSFHKGYISSDDTRRSNGCVRCTKPTLEALTTSLKNLSEVYILPDNDENKFVYENGQLNFRPKLDAGAPMTEDGLSYLNPKTGEKSNIPYYKDERGDWQKGQGVNKTNKTLNYIPIKVNTNKEALRSWGDKNMSGGYEDYGGLFVTTANDGNPKFENDIEPFTNSLAENKQKIMQVVGINGDVYNEIAQMTMGIYGAESSFGDTNNDGYNLMKAVRKWWNPANSSPDYYSKYNDYRASDNDNSVGLTQYRWKWALEDAEKGGKELEILNAVGITKNSDFMDPEKAALGTAAILAYRYNTQLSPDQKKDMWNNLPGKWNTAGYYGDRVKEGAALFSISQMTEEANNERLSERDKINKRREEDALPANVQARHEASLKRKAELERIEAAKSPEQKAAEEKMRSYEYIPEADTRANNKPQFEQYPQIDLTRPRIRGQRDARSGEEQSTVRGSGSNARSVYAPTLQPTAGRPVSNLHLRNYRKYGGEIKAKDIFIEYLKRKKNI